MAAECIIRHVRGKGYQFILHATNGRLVATSDHYESPHACLEGAEAVWRNATGGRLDDFTAGETAAATVGE